MLKWLPFLSLFANVKSNPFARASAMPRAFADGRDCAEAPAQTCWKGKKVPSGVLATSNVKARFSSLATMSTCRDPRSAKVVPLLGRT